MFIVGFNLKVWCSCLSDMVLWIKYCISFFVPKPWSPLCITWWSISNLYNIGLVGDCYIEIGIWYYQEWWNITGKLPPCIALCWNLVAITPSKVEAMRPHVRHSRCYFGNFLTLDGFLALSSNIICTETFYQNTNGEFFLFFSIIGIQQDSYGFHSKQDGRSWKRDGDKWDKCYVNVIMPL